MSDFEGLEHFYRDDDESDGELFDDQGNIDQDLFEVIESSCHTNYDDGLEQQEFEDAEEEDDFENL